MATDNRSADWIQKPMYMYNTECAYYCVLCSNCALYVVKLQMKPALCFKKNVFKKNSLQASTQQRNTSSQLCTAAECIFSGSV